MEQLYNYIVVTLLAPENAMRQYNRIAEFRDYNKLLEKMSLES